MSLAGRWADLVHRIATGGWKAKLILAPSVGVSYFGLIVVLVLLSLAVDRWLGFPKASTYPLSIVVGIAVIAFGLFLMVLSMSYFLKVGGTPVPLSPPPRLVTTGPYRFSRNPMVTGIFIQLFGVAILLGSISLAFIFTPLFILMNVWELKKVEEPELARRLGEPYVEYRKQVPMFFTCRRRRRSG